LVRLIINALGENDKKKKGYSNLYLDKIAAESNYSRNELINTILRYGVENLEIK